MRTQTALGVLSLCCAALAGTPQSAQAQTPNPWAAQETWLCRPGRQDPCAGPVARTTIATDGTATREIASADANAPVDCFFVYPTISTDPNGNSGLVPGPGERRAVEHQFAMFSSVCRTFAPMYRQITLAGLRSVMGNSPLPMDPELAYGDVLAAWKHYLSTENMGRGVVLIGHSQGSRWLTRLLQQEIEGKAEQRLLVSAILAGWNVEVPAGRDQGGTFRILPLCRSSSQTGCVISWATFRATSPPPANARYGRSRKPGIDVACVDPVALSASALKSYLPVQTNLMGVVPDQADWIEMAKTLDTLFVGLPGLLSVRCEREGSAAYLSASFAPSPDGRQPRDVPADIRSGGRVLDDWGLHLIDINLVAGNLQEVIRKQAAAYLERRSASRD